MGPEPVFVDTVLFLRFLTDDIPELADHIEVLLKRAAAGELALATNSLVIAEIVWTLESTYKVPRESVRDKVLAILNTPGLEVADEAWAATGQVDVSALETMLTNMLAAQLLNATKEASGESAGSGPLTLH